MRVYRLRPTVPLEIKGNFFKPQSGQAQESVEITSRIFLIVHNKR
jgi:hypothetical protein